MLSLLKMHSNQNCRKIVTHETDRKKVTRSSIFRVLGYKLIISLKSFRLLPYSCIHSLHFNIYQCNTFKKYFLLYEVSSSNVMQLFVAHKLVSSLFTYTGLRQHQRRGYSPSSVTFPSCWHKLLQVLANEVLNFKQLCFFFNVSIINLWYFIVW